MAYPELEQDGLAEIEIGTDASEIDAVEHQREIRRLHLVGVGQAEVGPSGDREGDLDVGAQVAVPPILAGDDQGLAVFAQPAIAIPGRAADPQVFAEGGARNHCVEEEVPGGAGIIPIEAKSPDQHDVAQVEPVLQEQIPAYGSPQVYITEAGHLEVRHVPVDSIAGELAARPQTIESIDLPVEVGPSQVPLLPIQPEGPGGPA